MLECGDREEQVFGEHGGAALATQALSYLKPGVAFDISKVCSEQNALQTLENSFLASTYTPAAFSSDDLKGLTTAMKFHLIDANIKEPAILQSYEKIIPKIDRARVTNCSGEREEKAEG